MVALAHDEQVAVELFDSVGQLALVVAERARYCLFDACQIDDNQRIGLLGGDVELALVPRVVDEIRSPEGCLLYTSDAATSDLV